MESSEVSFLHRNEFLIRRLHSLSGLIPVGAYMVVHLLTNASIMNSSASFQKNVHTIHSLGAILPFVEWAFIFLPIIFHAAIGFVIMAGWLPNTGSYPYKANYRYAAQRVSGMIAFVFIFWHVFHLHGWFHFDAWKSMAEGLNGANFRPFNASSSLYLAMRGFLTPTLYLIGAGSCIFHLANGIWTMGITWGVWVSPPAQRRASWACLALGVALMVVTCTAMVGVKKVDLKQAIAEEEKAIEVRRETGEITDEQIKHKAMTDDEKAEAEKIEAESLGKVDEPEVAQANHGQSSSTVGTN